MVKKKLFTKLVLTSCFKRLRGAVHPAFWSHFLSTWLRYASTLISPKGDTKSSDFPIRKPRRPTRHKKSVVKRKKRKSLITKLKKKKMANGVDRCFTCGLFGGQPEYNCSKCGIKVKCEHCGLVEIKMHVCFDKPQEEQ